MSEEKQLHPSVKKFKDFVANNPDLIKQVRGGQATWQELFEDWYLLGEDDPRWNNQKTEGEEKITELEGSKKDWISHFAEMAKKVEPAQIQSHLYNLSQAIGAIQGLLSQFQKSPVQQQSSPPEIQPQRPFPFQKD